MLQILARSCDNNYIFTKGAFKRKSFRSVLYPDTLCLLDRQIFVYFIVVVRLCSHGFETYAAMMMMMMSVSTRVLWSVRVAQLNVWPHAGFPGHSTIVLNAFTIHRLASIFALRSWYRRKHSRIEKEVQIPASIETNDPLREMTVIPYLEVRVLKNVLALEACLRLFSSFIVVGNKEIFY